VNALNGPGRRSALRTKRLSLPAAPATRSSSGRKRPIAADRRLELSSRRKDRSAQNATPGELMELHRGYAIIERS